MRTDHLALLSRLFRMKLLVSERSQDTERRRPKMTPDNSPARLHKRAHLSPRDTTSSLSISFYAAFPSVALFN